MNFRYVCDHSDFDDDCRACLQREFRSLTLILAALLSMSGDEIRIPKTALVESRFSTINRLDDSHSDEVILSLTEG